LDAVRAAGRLYYELHKDVYQRYRTENADKVRLCAKQSRLNHLAARVATEKSYRQRVKHHRAKTMRQWAEKNRDKVKAWRKANRDRLRVIGMKKYNKRRAALVNAQIGTDREAYTAFAMFLKSAAAVPCYWCGRTTTKYKRHIDHIIAPNAGGKDDVYNLCCSCPKCNCAKRDKLPEQFTGQYVLQFA
jgi:hypothetical protein